MGGSEHELVIFPGNSVLQGFPYAQFCRVADGDELAGAILNLKEAASVREFDRDFMAEGVYEGAVR